MRAMDTLTVSERLVSVGVPEPEAKAHAQILSEVTDDLKDELATKADLKVALAEMESRLAWRIIGAMAGLTAIFGIMLATIQMWAGG